MRFPLCPVWLTWFFSAISARAPRTLRYCVLETLKRSSISPDPVLADRRQRMVETQLRHRGIHDERVLAAMASVPRHEFVSESHRDWAYDDTPLPIG